MSTTTPRPIYVFDHVRSNSQLFNKLFAAHPQLEQLFMPLLGASLYGPEAALRWGRHSDQTERWLNEIDRVCGMAESETFSVAAERAEGAVKGIGEKGKIPWVKDHNFSVIPRSVQDFWLAGRSLSEELRRNPTVYSTQFLDGVTPVFLIRHPALSIPSFLRKDMSGSKDRASDEDYAIYSALVWSRMIFDSFVLRSSGGDDGSGHGVPIVVDAADVIYNSEAITEKLCQRLGIDSLGVQLSWPRVPEEKWPEDPIHRHFFEELYKSSGIERRAGKPSEESMDVDAMERGWYEEFGEENGKVLRKLVDAEFEHYEYLLKFKLRA